MFVLRMHAEVMRGSTIFFYSTQTEIRDRNMRYKCMDYAADLALNMRP